MRKKTVSDHLFSEESLSEEQLVRKSGEMDEQVIMKTLMRNHRAKRYESISQTDIRKSSDRNRIQTGMNDRITAVVAAVEVYRCRKQRIKNNVQLALDLELIDEEDTTMSQDDRRKYM